MGTGMGRAEDRQADMDEQARLLVDRHGRAALDVARQHVVNAAGDVPAQGIALLLLTAVERLVGAQ